MKRSYIRYAAFDLEGDILQIGQRWIDSWHFDPEITMNLIKKLTQWLLGEPISIQDNPPKTAEQTNLEAAVSLARAVNRASKEAKARRRETIKWSSFDDPFPMPQTKRAIESYLTAENSLKKAIDRWNSWVDKKLPMPPYNQWPKDFAEFVGSE